MKVPKYIQVNQLLNSQVILDSMSPSSHEGFIWSPTFNGQQNLKKGKGNAENIKCVARKNIKKRLNRFTVLCKEGLKYGASQFIVHKTVQQELRFCIGMVLHVSLWFIKQFREANM